MRAILAVFALAVLLVASGCADSRPTAPVTPVPVASVEVVYSISGVGDDVTVSMTTPTGTEQTQIETLGDDPVTFTYREGFARGSSLSVTAQASEEFIGLHCRILVDDVLLASNYTDADYGVVTCRGTA